MPSPVELYLDHLDRWAETGDADRRRITPEGVRPPLWTFAYRELFGEGTVTGFSYGLSSVDHPDWVEGRPELCVSMDSDRLDWVLAMGAVAAEWRGRSAFGGGEVFRLGSPISPDESGMSVFLVFLTTDVDKEAARIELPDRVVNLMQVYPLYEAELPLLDRIGPVELLSSDEVDFHDPRRPPIGGGGT